jgi:hypothetical protein
MASGGRRKFKTSGLLLEIEVGYQSFLSEFGNDTQSPTRTASSVMVEISQQDYLHLTDLVALRF